MAGAITVTRHTTRTLVVNPKPKKDPEVVPSPGTAFWGKITGDINRQGDLMAKFQAEAEARQAGDQAVRDDLLPLIYAAMVL